MPENTTISEDEVAVDPRPFGVFAAQPVHVPAQPEMATWPSACTIGKVPVPDDY